MNRPQQRVWCFDPRMFYFYLKPAIPLWIGWCNGLFLSRLLPSRSCFQQLALLGWFFLLTQKCSYFRVWVGLGAVEDDSDKLRYRLPGIDFTRLFIPTPQNKAIIIITTTTLGLSFEKSQHFVLCEVYSRMLVDFVDLICELNNCLIRGMIGYKYVHKRVMCYKNCCRAITNIWLLWSSLDIKGLIQIPWTLENMHVFLSLLSYFVSPSEDLRGHLSFLITLWKVQGLQGKGGIINMDYLFPFYIPIPSTNYG